MKEPNPQPSSAEDRRTAERGRSRAIAFVVILILAALVRLIPIAQTLTPAGVRLIPDGDPYYHLLRAQRIAQGHLDWFDLGMNFPVGAEIPWPPFFDALLAGASWIAAPWAGTPVRALELGAVFLPVVLGLVAVAWIGLLSKELFGRGFLGTALALAVLPGNFQCTYVGRADQHAIEALLLVAILLPFARAIREEEENRRARSSALSGVFLAVAFWSWLGSAFHLSILAFAAGAWHVVAPDDRSRARFASALGWAAAIAAAMLAVSLAAIGPPGALTSGRITGISGLSVALCGAAGLGALLLTWRSRHPANRAVRTLEVLGAGAIAGGALLLIPAMRGGIEHGLEALTRGNAWYRTIEEFEPILFSGKYPLKTEFLTAFFHYGLAPVAALAAIPALASLWRTEPDRRATILLVGACAVLIFPLAIIRRRMDMYAAVPLALLVPEGIRWMAGRIIPSRFRVAVAAALYAVAFAPVVAVADGLRRPPAVPEAEVVVRIAERLRLAGAAQAGGASEAILGPWARGHHLRYYTGLPVLATPFGTEGGSGAMEDSARFHLAATQAEAEQVLARRHVRWILLQSVDDEIMLGAALLDAPGLTMLSPHHSAAFVALAPAAYQRVGSRLYYAYGLGVNGASALDGFRLMDEDASGPESEPAKLFESVRGARLVVQGATPSSSVEALIEITAPSGRNFTFVTLAESDAGGRAELRIPYAAGQNGRTRASGCFVQDAKRRSMVVIPERAVLFGERIAVVLH